MGGRDQPRNSRSFGAMGSRDKDQKAPHHQPLLSSLVVRPSDTDGGSDGVAAGGGRSGRGADYEPGEVRRDPPLYSRSDRFSDEPGYRGRAVSTSPVRRRDVDIYNSDFDRPGGLPRRRDVGRGRDLGRHRDPSPPYSRGRVGGRPIGGRGFDVPAVGPGPHRGGDGLSRNNPNVRPREGDWLCPDPLCQNLNFARREHCNNCNRFRYAPGGSPPPRRGYPGPPPPPLAPPRRYPGPPMDRSPPRTMNGYKSPPRGWARDPPRDFGVGGLPPPRHETRFSDHPPLRRDRPDYPEDDFRGRSKFERPMPPIEWAHRDRGRDPFFNERKGYERRPPSPPPPVSQLPPQRGGGRWGRDIRERSRSPPRGGGGPPPARRDMYMDRGRDDRRGMGRDRIGGVY